MLHFWPKWILSVHSSLLAKIYIGTFVQILRRGSFMGLSFDNKEVYSSLLENIGDK